MIDFPHPEFVRALKLANRATPRGNVKAASRWLRLAEHHMKLYRIYNAGEDEQIEREQEKAEYLTTLPVYRIRYRYFTDPTDTPEAFAENQRRARQRRAALRRLPHDE